NNQAVLPLFVFDTSILNLLSKDDARVQFIFDQIESMKKELEEHRSSLYVYYGTPKEAFMALQKEYSILEVFTNRDYEPYAQSRDLEMNNWFSSQNISFTGAKDHVIFEKSEIVKDNGEPYSVFTPYSKKWKAKLTSDHLIEHKSQNYFHNLLQCAPIEMPSLASMGFTGSSLEFPKNKLDRGLIEAYAEKRDIPSVRGTSRLSLHLRFGTVSIRQLIRDGKNWSDTWLNELIWREFYQMILYHYPNSATEEFRPKYARIPWRTDMDDFELWCIGKTGYPLVDAGMRELNSTGFMHNRVRMVVASFLTKHLLLDWRLGERYFAEKLLDFELASNVGGWQWAAGCGCDAAPYFRVFNPELQMKKFDPDLKYVKTWVPEYGTPSYPDPIVEHKFARE
ncbi:MAG: cryptochrome/photolyase family protein, partial [Flavobacteriales bacterium]